MSNQEQQTKPDGGASVSTAMLCHTPAPWSVRNEDTGCPVIDAPAVGKGYYASIATATQRDPHPIFGGGISNETAHANARLIAAAPDLLKALIEANEETKLYPEHEGRWANVIAMAKGHN